MAQPESLATVEENGFSRGEPNGPAIQIDLDNLDLAWEPALPELGPAVPVEIAVVGHFDDRRSSACPAEFETACREPTTTVLGIPVISVPELIARRTGGPPPSPEEVAVQGWMIRSNVVYDCATDPDPHPLQPWCQPPVFLMERPELVTGLRPDGPSIVPVLGPDTHVEADIAWQQPVGVIAIGHLGDHRWPTCERAAHDACRRQFFVDRIVPGGTSVEEVQEPWRISGSGPIDPTAAPPDVIRSLETRVGDITVISLGYLGGDVLHEIEPAVAGRDDFDALFVHRPLWVVRALVTTGPDPAIARTFLIPDHTIYDSIVTIWEATSLNCRRSEFSRSAPRRRRGQRPSSAAHDPADPC